MPTTVQYVLCGFHSNPQGRFSSQGFAANPKDGSVRFVSWRKKIHGPGMAWYSKGLAGASTRVWEWLTVMPGLPNA